MSRLGVGWVLAIVLVVSGCSDDGTAGGYRVSNVDVDVDTAQLRTAKAKADIADCEPGRATPPADGGLPDLTLACLGGGPQVNLAELRGPLVLNLWAAWCGPCKEELPYYQQLHEGAGGAVDVIGIDYQDTQPDAALEVAGDAGVTYPLLADPAGQVRVPFRVARGLPGVVFVDDAGRVTHIEYLVIDSYAQLRDLVADHLGIDI